MKVYILLFMLLICLLINVQGQTNYPDFKRVLNVAVFVYPGVGLGDLQGPVDLFTKANKITNGQYKVYTIALQSGPIRTQGGTLEITPDFTDTNMPQPDILVLPGGSVGLADSMRYNSQVISFIRKYGDKVEVLMPVCTAAYFVGAAGILDGHKVTTHFLQAADLQSQFPKATVIKNVRFVDDGRLVTASGVTSSIDATLHLIARFSGEKTEKKVERSIQYTMHKNESWPHPVMGTIFDRAGLEKKGLLIKPSHSHN